MSRTRKKHIGLAVFGAMGVFVALYWAVALAQTVPVHITAQGVSVPMPQIESLDCVHLPDILGAIDSSGYRGSAPYPKDPADAPLFDYESALASMRFSRCLAAEDLGAAEDDPQILGISGAE